MPTLQTERLELIPFSSDLIKLLVADRAALAEKLAAQLPADWPEPDLDRVFRTDAWIARQDRSGDDWGGYLAILKAGRIVIGYPGFIGAPDSEGAVEIGYSIADSYQGQGFATEAVQALIEWALRQPQVKQVTAGCDSDNYASRRVLEKLGMRIVAQEGESLHWALIALVPCW